MMSGRAKCKDCWSRHSCLRNEEIRSSSFHKEDGCVRYVGITTSKGGVDATGVDNQRRNGEWETGFVNIVEI